MTRRKQEEKGQLYKDVLALILGFCMVYLSWEPTIYFWLDESKSSLEVSLSVFLCFLGLLLVLFSFYELLLIIQYEFQKQKPILEAITWKHLQMIEARDKNVEIDSVDAIAFEHPKIQALTRTSKDFIKTNQVVPVLSEEDVARIKNISIHFSVKK